MVLDWTEPAHDVNNMASHLQYTEDQSGGYGYAGLEGREDWPGVSDALVSYTAAAAAASPIPAPQHFYTQNDGVMTELGGVNGHAGTPVGGYPPSSVPQSTPTASLPPTPHHPGPHAAHRPVDLSQAQREAQPPPTPTIPYPLHDPHVHRPTLLDTAWPSADVKTYGFHRCKLLLLFDFLFFYLHFVCVGEGGGGGGRRG
ncbi:uncharacterized protein LOC122252793 [Penaeus japonicus]|uniref:uncharacterized protein LOC122252793 n=1 Tax=Penaeus japonicus TaxID=27405 RepID=UPI001C70FD1D|nr:uncharacterized protein LOC122252793 [Penaeus japonicus]